MSQKNQYDLAVLKLNDDIKTKQHNLLDLKKKLHISPVKNTDRYTAIAIAIAHVSIIEIYFQQVELYKTTYGKYQKSILDKIRKELGLCITLIAQVFGRSIPTTLGKNSKNISEMDKLSPKRLLNFLAKLNHIWGKLQKYYGISSKYSNPLAELYGELCRIMLNMIDFKTYINRSQNLSDSEYLDIKKLLTFLQETLSNVSENYIAVYNVHGSKTLLSEALVIIEFQMTLSRILNIDPDKLSELERKKQSLERLLT